MKRGLLTTRDELKALHEWLGVRPREKYYDRLQKRCSLILEAAPMKEIHWQSAWASGRWNAALTAARGAQGRILDLAIADGIDAHQAFRSRACEELRNLVGWSTWVDPSRSNLRVDLCTAEAAVGCTLGLDLLWDVLDERAREATQAALRQRVIEPYLASVEDDVWWYSAVNHWNAVINAAVGMTALAMSDDDHQAQRALLTAREGLGRFFDVLGKEGGWDEGIGYWGYALRYVLLLGRACDRLLDDQELLHHRGMDATAYFPIYFSPNGRSASFGDSTRLPLHGSLYLLDEYFNCPAMTWWLDEYSAAHDVSTTDWSQAGIALVVRPDRPAPVEPPALEPVKVFSQIGWGALADRWPKPGMYVSAKTGDLATSHAQRDMNSIQLIVGGESLLADLGHPPDEGSEYFSIARSGFYEVQARAHNTIVIAEEDHRPDAVGHILAERSGEDHRWMVLYAGDALGEGVGFYRHVVMLLQPDTGDGRGLLVLDELDSPSPEKADLYWHAGGEITFDATTMTGRIIGRRAGLHFGLAATQQVDPQTDKHPLGYGRTDQYLRVSTGLMGRCTIASVFSRRAFRGKVTVEVDEEGNAFVTFDSTRVTFTSGQRHLQLGQIEST